MDSASTPVPRAGSEPALFTGENDVQQNFLASSDALRPVTDQKKKEQYVIELANEKSLRLGFW